MKLKKYLKYKNSGIDWIGEIPVGWEVRRLKFINKLQGGYAFKSENFSEEGNDIIRIGDVKDNVDFKNAKKYPESIKIHKDFKIKNNDVLIALTGATIGKVGKVNNYSGKSYINQRVAKISGTNNYYYYLLKSDFIKKQIELIGDGSAQENISNGQIEDFFIPFNDKQEIISYFLDSKTLQIENLIEKDENLIELLKERRISLINKAVTKGLDDSVKMKDSDFGEIPFNSNIINIKYLSKSVVTGTTPTSSNLEYFKDELNWFTPGDFISQSLLDSKRKISKIAILDNECKLFPQNSVLLVSIGATLGKVAYSEEKFSCNQQINAIIPNENLHYKFLYYYLLVFQELIKSFSLETTLAILNQDRLKLIPIIVHNINEQQEIVEFLDKETVKIDNHIKKVEKRIELYEEYKKSLIYNVVTGKVEV